MKPLNRFFLLALAVSGLMAASLPAGADTAYHPVYRRSAAVGDVFSFLDIHHNNILLPEDYHNAANTLLFRAVDANHDGFLTRREFFARYGVHGSVLKHHPSSLRKQGPSTGRQTRFISDAADSITGDSLCTRTLAALNGDDCLYPKVCEGK
jgi:hypothetical protein